MAVNFGTSALLATVFVLFLTVGQGEGLRCWLCSSDSTPHCADPFNSTSRVPKYSLVDCDARSSSTNQQYASDVRAVCRKSIRLVREDRVTTRGCAWEPRDAPADECMSEKTPSFVKIESCFTCDTDACNGALPAAPLAATTLIGTVIAALVAKVMV